MDEGFPARASVGAANDDKRREMATVPYRELVCCLLYISKRTRPDICFAVGVLCRYVNDPTKLHWNAAKRVLRYLRGTPNLGVLIDGVHENEAKEMEMEMNAYYDADWAGDRSDRRSTTGFILMLNSAVVSWRSQKQR